LGHVDQVNFADFSPDDQQIVTASNDRTIRVWDAATAEQAAVIGGGGSPAVDADFSGDGTRLAVGYVDGTIIVWDVESGDDLLRIKAHDFGLSGLDFSPNGQRIVTAGSDGPARVWNAETGRQVLVLEGHEGVVTDAAFSPDNANIATVGDDGQLMVWDARSGDLVVFRTDAARFGGLDYVTYSADGSRIATYSEADGRIGIWGATSGDPFLSVGNKYGTSSIQFSPDGNGILTSNNDGTVAVWNSYGGGLMEFLEAHPNFVRSAAFSPDGSLVVTASDDTTAKVWDIETGEEIFTLLGHGNWLSSATFSPNGRLVATTDVDGVTKLWNIAARALIPELEHDGSPIRLASYTPDGQLLVTTADDFSVRVWDVENGRQTRSIPGVNLDQTPFDGTNNLALLPVVNESGSIDLWDVNSGEVLVTLAGHEEWVSKADVSADGRTVVSVGCDVLEEGGDLCAEGTIKVWDGTSGDEMFAWPYETINDDNAKAFELSRDGTRLVTGSCVEYDEETFDCLDSQLTIWDTTAGDEISSWSIGPGLVSWIDYSPDRSGIFTTNGSETQLWDATSGELIQTVSGFYETTDSQGERVVTLGDNFMAMIWDIRTGALLGTISGHRDEITSIEFSPDGTRLITSSWDGTARVWDSSTGVEILNLSDQGGQVWQAHFSPDGTSIVTAGEDGTARIWPFGADKLLELSAPAVQRYSPFLTPTELARFGLDGN
jgi:WD40 repeat protein